MTPSASLVLFAAGLAAAGPARADETPPAFVDPAALRARAEALRDAVADPSVSDVAVKERARGFFDRLPEETLVVPVYRRRMDREPVAGKPGTIAGMQAAADARLELWRRAHGEPPPPDLESVAAEARALRDGGRLGYDEKGALEPGQLGIFRYMRDRLDGGVVELNERLRALAALVGEAFTYATVVHEAAHSRDRAAGRLSPDAEIAGEASAFRIQFQWLKLMDPSGERMLTLHSALKLRAAREADPRMREALKGAVEYLEHLSDVVATDGKEKELRELAERLYGGGRHGDGKRAPASA